MKVWLIADTHFGDENIRRYEDRPFATCEEMDQELVRRWNACVSEEDMVYHLGDVGQLAPVEKLRGHKILLRGNHDTASDETYLQAGFEKVYDLPVVYGGFFILSHEPLYMNRNMPYANVYGHVHSNPSYRTVSERSHCVSVERIDYAPIALEEVRSAIQKEEAQYDLSH